MKILNKISILFLAFVLMNCGEEEQDPTTTDLIKGTWRIQNITVDGSDATSDFSGLTITFKDDFTFTSTNGGVVVPSSGSYSPQGSPDFVAFDLSTNENSIFISFSCQILEITSSTLNISFSISSTLLTTGGRTESRQGSYQINLTK